MRVDVSPEGHAAGITELCYSPTTVHELSAADYVGGIAKRAVDIIFGVLSLIILLPTFIIVCLLIKLSDGGSIFYRHVRIGRGGQLFNCYKFRTMVLDGEAVLAAHLRENPQLRTEWNASQKLRDDPRVTAIGKVLRKFSIDELPQLLNIVRGDMSLVGPRPIVPGELARYGQDLRFYLRARPGLTGLWQVSGRSDTSYDQRVALDRQYVENWALWKDVFIIIKTVPAVISAKGTY